MLCCRKGDWDFDWVCCAVDKGTGILIVLCCRPRDWDFY